MDGTTKINRWMDEMKKDDGWTKGWWMDGTTKKCMEWQNNGWMDGM